MARIGIFGAGYVGLVTGACFADLGHDVVIRDVVSEKIDRLRRGEVPIHEPGLGELLARNRERLRFTLEVDEALEEAEVVYVAVKVQHPERNAHPESSARFRWSCVWLPSSKPAATSASSSARVSSSAAKGSRLT